MGDTVFNIYEAKKHLSSLLQRASAGEEIIIAKAGQPIAKLVPVRPRGQTRRPGGWEGRVYIADDFDAPLPSDIQAAFEGES